MFIYTHMCVPNVYTHFENNYKGSFLLKYTSFSVNSYQLLKCAYIILGTLCIFVGRGEWNCAAKNV